MRTLRGQGERFMHPMLIFARRLGLTDDGFQIALLLSAALLILAVVLNTATSGSDVLHSATALGN